VVVSFFIAGLLYLLCLKHVDNLGAYSIPSETGLLIPSVISSFVAGIVYAGGDRFRPSFAPFSIEGDIAMMPGLIAVDENTNLRELCKAVSEEEDSGTVKLLLDELYRALDERELLVSLL
jgi:hypothetical protein